MNRFLILLAVVASIHLLGLAVSILQSGSLRAGWALWKRRLEGFSAFLGQCVLVVFYFLVVPFFVFPVRSKDPLRYRAVGWIPRATKDLTRIDAEKQF